MEALDELALRLLSPRVCFGTLWWVGEDVWETYQENYRRWGDREGHPGVSLLLGRLLLYRDRLPMLFGRSPKLGQTGPVLAVCNPRKPSRLTVFGTLVEPARIPLRELDPGETEPRVQPWEFKPQLDPNEKTALLAWYDRNVKKP